MRLSLAFHIIGIIFWGGGLMIVSRLLKGFTQPYDAQSQWVILVKKLTYGFVLPGALITLLSGLNQIFTMGMAYYMSQGWFHAKLLFVLILFGLTGVLLSEARKVMRGEVLKASKPMAIHGATSLLVVVITFITMLFRH